MSTSPGRSPSWKPLAEALLGRADFTPGEVADIAGVSIEHARRLWQGLGFPPVADEERAFTRADAEILRAVRLLSETQGAVPADQLTLTRVIGQAMERVADAQVSIAAARLNWLDSESVWNDASVAALVERIQVLAPSLEQFLGYVWRRHLLAAVLRAAAMPSAAERPLIIGFADLVGFTAFSQALDARELAGIVERFEAVAYAHIPERGGRVVKMIGDEVMFSVEDGAIAAEIALSLVEAHQRDAELPDVRVGLASGPTLAWEGDLYGPTVNLASRLVNLARPRTVLLSDDLGQHLHERDGFALHHLRPVNLQGIGRVRAWVLRRAVT